MEEIVGHIGRTPETEQALDAIARGSNLLIKGKAGIVIFTIHVLAAVGLQIIIGLGGQMPDGYGNFIWLLVTLLLAFAWWVLDCKGVLFQPDNHLIQGHALWHLISSLCFIFVYHHYTQYTFF